jgi:hypothetical protein
MPIPGEQSAAEIGEAQHRGAAFPDSELASGVNARRSNPEQWLTICVGELDRRDRSRPERKASPDYPLSSALTISLGGSEPNGEIKTLDAETTKG